MSRYQNQSDEEITQDVDELVEADYYVGFYETNQLNKNIPVKRINLDTWKPKIEVSKGEHDLNKINT